MTQPDDYQAYEAKYLRTFELYLAHQGYLDASGKPKLHYKKRVQGLKAIFRAWRKVFGKPFGGPITREAIMQVLQYMYDHGRSHATLVDDLAALRAFWACNMALPNSKITVNIVAGLKAPGQPKRKRAAKDKAIRRLVHQLLVRLDDELYDYLVSLQNDGSLQDVVRRIIEEHRSFGAMSTILKLQQTADAKMEGRFDAHLDEMKNVFYAEAEARQREQLALQTYMACLFITASNKNPDWFFRESAGYVEAYAKAFLERIEAEVAVLTALLNTEQAA